GSGGGGVTGLDGGTATGDGAEAGVRPGKRTVAWHFGQRTLKARSGTFASSITIFWVHCGQFACTSYLSIKSSISERGAGFGAVATLERFVVGAAGFSSLNPIAGSGTPPADEVSSRKARFVRLLA